jgi:hypothetical protein
MGGVADIGNFIVVDVGFGVGILIDVIGQGAILRQ